MVKNLFRGLFLVLFVFLIVQGKNILWLSLFAISLLLSVFFGRFYCGYICPMNTLMKFSEGISKKMGWQTENAPKWLKSGIFSWVILLVSVGSMIVGKRIFHKNIPILVMLIVFSIIVTLRFKPYIFHNGICPFGALLRLTGRFSIISKKVDHSKCVGCKKCESVCPSKAILVTDRKATIDTKLCFQCENCSEVCPVDAISYKR